MPSKADLYRHLAEWIEAAGLAQLRTLNALRVAVRLHFFAGRSESKSRFYSTGEVEAWPGVGRLSRDLDISEDAVRRSLHRLEEAGLIVIIHSDGGRALTNSYVLVPQKPPRTSVVVSSRRNDHESTRAFHEEKPRTRVAKTTTDRRGGNTPPTGGGDEYVRARAWRDAASVGDATASPRGARLYDVSELRPILNSDGLISDEIAISSDGSQVLLEELSDHDFDLFLNRYRERGILDPHADR